MATTRSTIAASAFGAWKHPSANAVANAAPSARIPRHFMCRSLARGGRARVSVACDGYAIAQREKALSGWRTPHDSRKAKTQSTARRNTRRRRSALRVLEALAGARLAVL